MPDDFPNDDETLFEPSDDENGENSDIPASVIFSEMMRRAASQTRPLPVEADSPAPPDTVPEVTNTGEVAEPGASTEPSRYEQARKEQKERRVQRRKERRRSRTTGVIGGFLRTMIVVFMAAGLVSTIFTYFTDPRSFGPKVVSGIQVADATGLATIQPTIIPVTPNWMKVIGIVSGHRGPENDPGAVCPDGLTEAEINFNVSQQIVQMLRARGYNAELLDEFDPRLEGYQAAALVSIHANTCQDFGELVSGYLVAKAAARPDGGPDVVLAECVADYYQQGTGLERRFTLTTDMTNYHTFREIHPKTPAAIIELGFMLHDRDLLTRRQDVLAESIMSGILCFIEPAAVPRPAETPPPADA